MAFAFCLPYSEGMSYEQIVDFVQNRMRMSHVYQPVMMLALLRGGGRASTTEIARSILEHDESQVEYYKKTTENMVGHVLRTHQVAEREGAGYALAGHDDLDAEQVQDLIGLCESKLKEYKARRGRRIWQHRRASAGYVPGTARYEVLKRATRSSSALGSAASRAGCWRTSGSGSRPPRAPCQGRHRQPGNLQALCYSCNVTKRD